MNINLDVVPSSLDQALDILDKALEDEDIEYMLEHTDPHGTHFGLGMWMRNNWSLWHPETNLAQWFRQNLGLGHADDMSGIILDSFWRRVRGEPIDLEGQVQFYKDFWKKQNIDPLTQQKIN